MRTFKKSMSKAEWLHFVADFVEDDSRLGHVNSESGMKLSDFRNWDGWFGFGEFDNGERAIYCTLDDEWKDAITYIKQKGFVET